MQSTQVQTVKFRGGKHNPLAFINNALDIRRLAALGVAHAEKGYRVFLATMGVEGSIRQKLTANIPLSATAGYRYFSYTWSDPGGEFVLLEISDEVGSDSAADVVGNPADKFCVEIARALAQNIANSPAISTNDAFALLPKGGMMTSAVIVPKSGRPLNLMALGLHNVRGVEPNDGTVQLLAVDNDGNLRVLEDVGDYSDTSAWKTVKLLAEGGQEFKFAGDYVYVGRPRTNSEGNVVVNVYAEGKTATVEYQPGASDGVVKHVSDAHGHFAIGASSLVDEAESFVAVKDMKNGRQLVVAPNNTALFAAIAASAMH